MKEKIIDLNNPKLWITDFSAFLDEINLKVPSYNHLCKWANCDYKLSRNDLNLVNHIKKNKIILYHGTKTFETKTFYENGIQIPNKEFYFDLFMRYTKNMNLELSSEQTILLNNLINEKEVEKQLFALLLPHSFTKECSHYIGLGSEWITSLFIQIFKQKNAYEMLYSIGKPTIFKIIIPISELNDYNCQYVCGEILKCYLDTKDGYQYLNYGTVVMYKEVSPEHINSHFFIEKFYSYHMQNYVSINI